MAANQNYWRQRAALYARRYGIPANVFLAQINQESGFNPNAHSSAGAQGIAQIMPFWHVGNNPDAQLNWAAKHDAQGYKKYGDWQDVLSVYNSGRPWSQGQRIGQTNNYVHSILGASGAPGRTTPNVGGAPGGSGGIASPAMGNMLDFRKTAAAYFLQRAQGDINSPQQGALGLALARQQFQAAQDMHGGIGASQAAPSGPTGAPRGNGSISFLGKPLAGEHAGFLGALQQAARAAGATRINVTSGYRNPQHNAAVGGVQGSQHTRGDAMDGYGFVPGHGWVPLGTLLRNVAGRYGLRSGDQPGFYNGGPDPVHVDGGGHF